MYINKLKILMLKRQLNMIQIAEMANISKQAVSLWFKSDKPFIDLKISHLMKLCKSLGVPLQFMVDSLPLIKNQDVENNYKTLLCWDKLYPSLLDFLIALINSEHKALARIVQIYGLYQSEKICGVSIWTDFHKYKRYIHPARKKECEFIWNFHQNQI